jgi:hypothetical protein
MSKHETKESNPHLYDRAVRARVSILGGLSGTVLPYFYSLLSANSNDLVHSMQTAGADFSIGYLGGLIGAAAPSEERVIFDPSLRSRALRVMRDVACITLGTAATIATRGSSPLEAILGAASTTSGVIFTRRLNKEIRVKHDSNDPRYKLPISSGSFDID